MSKKRGVIGPHIEYHKDGSIWAKGKTVDGVPTGYWEWFRKTGTLMRSGTFDNGRQVGEWTTYDQAGDVYKVTRMKPAPPAGAAPGKKIAGNGGKQVGKKAGKNAGQNTTGKQ